LKSKILISSIGYYFVLFILLAFLTSFFFPFHLSKLVKKFSKFLWCFYYTDYRFYQRILETSWIFIEKNRDILNTKHLQNFIVYYLLFYFLVFLTFFFLKIFVFFILWIRDFVKEFCKIMVFFFKKIWYIWKPKFHQNSIISFFFSIFYIFFFLFHLSKLDKKLFNFFLVFYWKD